MARELINGLSMPVPGTGEPSNFQGELRRIATDLPISIAEQVTTVNVLSSPVATVAGDGTTDDAAAILAIANAAASFGFGVFFPGDTTYLLGTAVNIPAGSRWTGGAGATLKLADAAETNLIQTADTSNVVLRNLTLDGNGANQATTGHSIFLGQHVSAVNDVQIIDCRFLNAKSYGIRTTGTTAVGNRLTVRGCHFEGLCGIGAVETQNDDDVLVTDCTFFNITGRAVYIGNPASGGERAVIVGNRLRQVGGFGIEVQNVAGAIVSDNSLHTITSYGISMDTCPGAVVTGNRVVAYGGVGIEFVACDGYTNTGNYVEFTAGGAAGTGIMIDRSQRGTTSGCTVIGFGIDGIHVAGNVAAADQNTISACVFKGNHGLAVGVRLNTTNHTTVTGCTFTGTLFVGVRGAVALFTVVTGCGFVAVIYGVYFDGCPDSSVTGCEMTGTATANGNGITWTGTATGMSAVGNRIKGFTGTPAAAIAVDAGIDYIRILGNDTRGNTAGISGTSANQLVANNF